MRRRFQQVDVFAPRAFTGNPLAVVLDGEGLSTEEMLSVTRWLNLSETTFLLPPTTGAADYRVRIFTLARELPFAGHPTLGSCHAWLTAGGTPRQSDRVVQECSAGLIAVKRDGDRLAFAAPPLLRSGPLDEPHLLHLASVLGIRRDQVVDAQWVDNGPGWVGILLADAATVLAIDPDFSRHPGPDTLDIGLVSPAPRGSECAFEVRAVFSDEQGGMREDPVTGSLNASLAQWLLASGRATAPYVVSQGTRLGRAGRVHIDRDSEGTVWVGGKATTCVSGEIEI
ncbi:MAG: PhzF family phenazine biosynthesis protein [Gemmatimonadota bacterium]|nr:PhzF family phenazine biosynthesis protein [Gemmatimonadota bacterium]